MLNKVELSNDQLESLSQFTKYIWWKTKDEILEKPYRLIAQVMNIGTLEDIFLLKKIVGDDCLLYTLKNAEVGQFSERSWHFWHYKLTDIKADGVPPMPTRKFD